VAFSFFNGKKAVKPRREMPGTPAIRCSICTGEQVAGFLIRESGRFEEVTLIRGEEDLENFRRQYGITGEIEKIY